ncbi:MAG: aspartate aminotransferase family protein [Pseudomonadota bacterium]
MEAAAFSVEDRYLIASYAKFPISIEKGEGSYVWDSNGNRYLDLYGGHAVALLGHSHPRLVRVLSEQASRLLFYSSITYSSIRGTSAEALVKFVGGDRQVFFSNSGAEANENALKIARIATGRPTFVSFEGSFHGRTMGAIGVTGISKYRSEDLPNVRFAKFGEIESLESKLDSTVAAVLFEPIQSLSGIRQAEREFFLQAADLCAKAGTLVIFDEIQTGLGRTGSPMYFRKVDVDPDLVTLAKGLAGGIPIGATLAKREIAAKTKLGDLGSTFGGGPVACALAQETIRVLIEQEIHARVERIGRELKERLKAIPGVQEVRGEGFLIGIRTKRAGADVVRDLLGKGILVGTSLDPEVVRLMPPLTIGEMDLETFISKFTEVV